MADFVHLHVHTQYSLLDGSIMVKSLMKELTKLNMQAVAITDHSNMFGVVDFVHSCEANKIKPIIGIEFDVTASENNKKVQKPYHMTFLCKNLTGYHNILKLVSKAYTENYDEYLKRATMKFEWFREVGTEGIIALTGDLGGELPQAILMNEDPSPIIRNLRDNFEEGNLYFEIMRNHFPEQERVTEALISLSKIHDLPLVATNDCHYLSPEEAEAHAILMCMQLERRVQLEELRASVRSDFYLKTSEEMWHAFEDVPEACENTLKIADEITLKVPLGPSYLPQYPVPKEFLIENNISDDPTNKEAAKEGIHAYFCEVARKGLEKRFHNFREHGKIVDEPAYRERLEREIGVIRQMDFPGYFLIVWDFINWSKEHGVPVGPGRGSGAGSLVAYSMRITDIDPIPYSLLFERFLNPERVSMPDFDIDFCRDKRGETIKYVTEKYGKNNVAQIATFGGLKAKACLKSVARVLNFLPSESDVIAKLVPAKDPDDPGHDIKLQRAIELEPKLKALYEEDERTRTLFDYALKLENRFSSMGMHAAGIVISEGPIWDYVPVCRGANGETVSMYQKGDVEEAGLIKFDFLGLKTLTVLATTMKLVNRSRAERGEPPLDVNDLEPTDPEVYKLISSGSTTGIFQLESSGFTQLLMKLKPDCFEDIIAAVALYRPGPMGSGMIDTFINCKHGLQEIEYPHPLLSGILKETYGVFVYQEQVMQAAQVLSGFTLGGADIMRRAMGKKKIEVMLQQRSKFIEGAAKNDVPAEQAGEIFDKIQQFAAYGFNKSHSAAYALITYQTAYLKQYYPVEFYAGLMSCDRSDTAKVVRTIFDARKNGIAVLPPDINASIQDFSVVDGKARFGLGGIKGVGDGAIESIVEARESEGPFKNLFDFCERVDLKRVNRRVLEALIKAGAFDSTWHEPIHNINDIGRARAQMFISIQNAIDSGIKAQQDKEVGQKSIFSFFAPKSNHEETKLSKPLYLTCQAWSEHEVLQLEKGLMGFFISGHPLDRYLNELSLYTTHNTETIQDLNDGAYVCLAGVVSAYRDKVLKSGDGRKMAFVSLEDCYGQISAMCPAKSYNTCADFLKSDSVLILSGRVKIDIIPSDDPDADDQKSIEIILDHCEPIAGKREEVVGFVLFNLDVTETKQDIQKLEKLFELVRNNPGNCGSYLRLTYPNATTVTLPLTKYPVKASDSLILNAEELLGRNAIQMKPRIGYKPVQHSKPSYARTRA